MITRMTSPALGEIPSSFVSMQTWERWQSEIVNLLQKDFGGEALRQNLPPYSG
jgi:hypothetical protein